MWCAARPREMVVHLGLVTLFPRECRGERVRPGDVAHVQEGDPTAVVIRCTGRATGCPGGGRGAVATAAAIGHRRMSMVRPSRSATVVAAAPRVPVCLGPCRERLEHVHSGDLLLAKLVDSAGKAVREGEESRLQEGRHVSQRRSIPWRVVVVDLVGGGVVRGEAAQRLGLLFLLRGDVGGG